MNKANDNYYEYEAGTLVVTTENNQISVVIEPNETLDYNELQPLDEIVIISDSGSKIELRTIVTNTEVSFIDQVNEMLLLGDELTRIFDMDDETVSVHRVLDKNVNVIHKNGDKIKMDVKRPLDTTKPQKFIPLDNYFSNERVVEATREILSLADKDDLTDEEIIAIFNKIA